MKKKKMLLHDNLFFQKWTVGTKKIIQDKVYHNKRLNNKLRQFSKKQILEENLHTHYFSNKNTYFLLKNDPICYIRNSIFCEHLKNLKTGKYIPEIILDLHGLTQYQSKQELGRLFFICEKERLSCVGIIYGHGKNILKSYIPFWLSQHPKVIAFHEAPKKFGSNVALFVLIEIS